MSKAKWNLDDIEIPSIEIIQISLLPQARDTSQYANNLRLLLLSHSIAYNGTPAFYLESPPGYSAYQTGNSVVIVFDFNHSFDNYQIDTQTFESHKWTWIATSELTNEFLDNFQRALALRSLYQFKKYNPLYFTTFIIVPGTEMLSDPFIYQKVPVRCGNVLRFRVIIQGSLDMLLNYTMPVQPGNYILLPPYEHLFSVVSSNSTSMTILYVDKTQPRKTIIPSQQPYVLIAKPNVSLSNYFSNVVSNRSDLNESIRHFPPVDFMNYTKEDIESYFSSRFVDDSEEQGVESRFEFAEPKGTEILYEQITNKEEREVISSIVGDDPQFPSHRCHLTLILASFLSFFRFDFGFSKVKPPTNGQILGSYSFINYERLGIPNILINNHGKLDDVPADRVIEQWEENRYLPISGEKSAHFVVFCQKSMNEKAVESFFNQFCHIYSLLGFGLLSPFPRFDAFYYTPTEDIASEIDRFFKSQPLSEFQEHPILTFIVSNPIYDSSFMPRTIINYVRPWSITSASEDEMKTLAFVVYSRIRLFSPTPFGMIDIGTHDTATLFFGFRYQPPFLLRRNGNEMTLHIAYDPQTNLTAWMDDVGSVLHVLKLNSLSKVKELVQDAVSANQIDDAKVTLSILAEGITSELNQSIQYDFRFDFPNYKLFSVYPSPTVQIIIDEAFDDDAAIFANVEQAWEGEFLQPLSSVYVVSHCQPAYHVSLYTKDAWKSPESDILDYVRKMSHLSWLSVKPGSEKRTISYPPHICALLRKSCKETLVVNRFEFLPSTERI
ncbi:hypothetical protein TRFO_39786 [Tritrichomonas foetus]|uniref:Uncharacterized protein n=1 Tax=Tritrichomonas foetus TaxID=1144522 RepID=A0A1J4J3V1_9EUKA|nr:hypothetical protein TRFO_39786 [Tritrichomonas foetus]|eukprot:OHS94042.1 hypothetical protein TRFO_39786 [Tritrichomonas foetus]